jgi:uncharacterized protein YciI
MKRSLYCLWIALALPALGLPLASRAEPFGWYVIIAEDVPSSSVRRAAARTAHLERLAELHNQNRLLVAGPFPIPGSREVSGSLIIASFPSLEEAKAWADADPYVAFDVYAKVTVLPFRKLLPPDDNRR